MLGFSQEIILSPENNPHLQFVKDEILPAVKKFKVSIICDASEVQTIYRKNNLSPPKYAGTQRYAIRRKGQQIWVLADNTIGGMYGGLDVADALRVNHPEWLENKDQQPYLVERGIKFNIPLDVRTHRYTDPSDASQANIPEVWKEEFWKEYFDEMARNRMNTMTSGV